MSHASYPLHLHYMGLPALDNSRQAFFGLLGALPFAERENTAPQVIERIIERAREHFALEERFMQATAYGKQREHCEEHQETLDMLQRMQASFGQANGRRSREALYQRVLRNLDEHIQSLDACLALHLQRPQSWEAQQQVA
ncbi:hemerythrin family protein [Pseudomonas sp. UBA6310]|uniref:hemerythrin family protein n=1 Tax=Pseudomonas sp. UBA6310 TaxID=1947327 RepID=UPI00257C60D8|nr:hemerythrin family protein [Pseudomonas sp. UBA6310]